MSTPLTNHPQFWLRSDAAAAFDRAETDHGVFTVNSAGRTVAQQQQLIDRWDAGGKYNRPPYLYAPARPATASNHVRNGGVAVDIGDWQRFATISGKYGFVHSYPSGDPVHFDFVGGGVAGLPNTPIEKEETEMPRYIWTDDNAAVNGVGYALFDSGYTDGVIVTADKAIADRLSRVAADRAGVPGAPAKVSRAEFNAQCEAATWLWRQYAAKQGGIATDLTPVISAVTTQADRVIAAVPTPRAERCRIPRRDSQRLN